MKLMLCPRCELNYITDSEEFCKICLREMHGDKSQDEAELCSVCNEYPCLPGHDVCSYCLKEMSANDSEDEENNQENEEEGSDSVSLSGIDSVANMDEIIPELEDDMPAEMSEALSLESVREEEERAAAEEDEEPEET